MEQEKSLVSQESSSLNIHEGKARANTQIAIAQHWATKLVAVVDQCGMATDIGGKKYLNVEGWQIIGEFAGVRALIEWAKPWIDETNGEYMGYEARCVLKDKEGNEVGSGESLCGFDSFPCRGKDGSEKQKAAKSAAQTWAISRTYRNRFAYVAKLGGYEPTPAEEMTTEPQETLGPCPKCGKAEAVIRGQEKFGGGFVCWKKRGGCGNTWKEAKPFPLKSESKTDVKKSIYEETDTHKKLEAILFEHCNGDMIAMGEMLEGLTQWESNGKVHPGKKEIGAITEKMATIAIDKFHQLFGEKK